MADRAQWNRSFADRTNDGLSRFEAHPWVSVELVAAHARVRPGAAIDMGGGALTALDVSSEGLPVRCCVPTARAAAIEAHLPGVFTLVERRRNLLVTPAGGHRWFQASVFRKAV